MTIQDQIRTALSNVGRRKLRSALASLGVVVGTLTIVIMVSLASGVRQQINRQFASIGLDRLTVTPAGAAGAADSALPVSICLVRSRPKKSSPRRMSAAGSNCPASPRLFPKSTCRARSDWNCNANGTNQPVRLTGAEPVRGNFSFQELPEPVAGSLELPESGGIILSQGTAQSLGISSNKFAGMIGQNVEAILRTSRGETQSFPLRVQGISQESSRDIQVSIADRIAMKDWWFNSTNTLEREGYDFVTIRSTDVTRAIALTAQIRQEGFQVQSLEIVVEVANRIVTAITVMFTLIGEHRAARGHHRHCQHHGHGHLRTHPRNRHSQGHGRITGRNPADVHDGSGLHRTHRRRHRFVARLAGRAGPKPGHSAFIRGIGNFRCMAISLSSPSALAVGVIMFATFIGLVAGLLPAQRAAKLDPLQALRHE